MSNRFTLKSFFKTNDIPTADQFADLIDSSLNPLDDGIRKLPAGPIALEAQPDKGGSQDVLHFFKNFKDTGPAWRLSLPTGNNSLNVVDSANQSRLFIRDGSGNVGVSQPNPQGKLHISGGNLVVEGNIGVNVPIPGFPLTFANQLGQKMVLWGSSPNQLYGLGIGNAALLIHTDTPAADVLFGHGSSTAFTETVRIKGNGNMGIGTNAPRAKLEVAGGAIIPAIGNGANAGILFGSDPAGGGGDTAWIRYAAQNFGPDGSPVRDDKSVLEIGVGNDWDDNIALMPSGNVGIGTRNPTAKLHLATGNLMVDKGRIGIGTANPYSQLANTDKNTIGSDGQGGNAGSLAWAANQNGYIAQFFNEGGAPNSNGVAIKVASATATILDISQGPQGNHSPTIFAVKGNGSVGIGTNNPDAKLHVAGSVRKDYTAVAYGFLNSNATPTGRWAANAPNVFPVSILANDRIVASEFDAISDRRIKQHFAENDPQESLIQLSAIRINDYRYKDEIGRGDSLHKGVIAQELETVMPEAVLQHTDFIPDIYALPLTTAVEEGTLTVTLEEPHGLASGDVVRLMLAGGAREVVVGVVSDFSFSVNEWNEPSTGIFVYGKQVADFRTVNYNSIFCLGISAIQALHRQVQHLRDEVSILKQKLSATLIPAF